MLHIVYKQNQKQEGRIGEAVYQKEYYLSKKTLEKSFLANMNVCLRKSKKEHSNYKAKFNQNPKFISNPIKFDYGYKFLTLIRSLPPYWKSKKKDLMAMLRQLGKPTFFLTLSAAETRWPELVKFLFRLKYNKPLLMEMCDNQKL